MRFWGFWQKSNQFICTILLEYESTYRFSNSLQKLHDWKKIWSCCNCQEPIRPIRMRNSLNCNISKTSWGMKFDFCLWWGIHWNQQIYPFISSGCGRACQKLCKIATQLYRKNVLSCKASFFACGLGPAEVTDLFNHCRWICSGMLNVIENNELTGPQKWS